MFRGCPFSSASYSMNASRPPGVVRNGSGISPAAHTNRYRPVANTCPTFCSQKSSISCFTKAPLER